MLVRFKLFRFCLVALVVLTFAGCAVQGRLQPETVSDDLDAESLRAAIRHSVAYLQKLPGDRIVGEAPRRLTAAEVLRSLLAFDKLLDHWDCAACLVRELAARFELLPSSADAQSAEVLFTGYYQPVLEGSLAPSEEYRYPLYSKPADLMTAEQVTLLPAENVERAAGRVENEDFIPYYSRREIDELGSLRGRGLEIAWIKDPVDLFFLHIQGSGIVRLPDGNEISVGYAAQNGWPYRSIGRLLIDNGKIPPQEMSMQRLRRYLSENPQERNEIFAYNESYVFFRIVENGPLGSLEVPVTAGRSIATDARLFPRGAAILMQTELPVIGPGGELAGWRPVTRFILNQDSGGAIRGFQRADIYFGTGAQAGGLAGYMNRQGRMFFLVLKQDQRESRDRELR